MSTIRPRIVCTRPHYVVHSPTLTNSLATGEYCQHVARVFSTNAQTIDVVRGTVTWPSTVDDSAISRLSAPAAAGV